MNTNQAKKCFGWLRQGWLPQESGKHLLEELAVRYRTEPPGANSAAGSDRAGTASIRRHHGTAMASLQALQWVSDDDFSRRRRRDYLVTLVRSVRPPQCGCRAAFDVRTRLGELSITCSFGLMLAAVSHDSIVKRGSDLRRQVFSAVRNAAQLMRSRLPRAKQAANGKEMSQRRPLGFVARSRLEQDLDCTVRVRGQMHKNTEPSWRQRQTSNLSISGQGPFLAGTPLASTTRSQMCAGQLHQSLL